MRDVVILGSTGSIGTQTLDVIERNRDRFRVVGLSAGGGQLDLLAEQITRLQPKVVAVPTNEAAQGLRDRLGADTPELLTSGGNEALAAANCDVVVNAITGAAGLQPTLVTLQAGTQLALANKESLVIGGRLVMDAAAPGQLIPVDSEHSAILQSLRSGARSEVRRLILTASGGPFRGRSRAELTEVTPAQALAHPSWNMGRVITINSATLVNKGLEVLEAALLYDMNLDDITVVVHPTSDVHSMVEFMDGATIAQASPPDMRLPIALALGWPERIADASASYDWSQPRNWQFEPLDDEAFPAVQLARTCGRAGGTAPAVFNAANEVCVDAFCDGRLSFLGIVDTVSAVVAEHLSSGHVGDPELSVEAVLGADGWARERATQLVG